MKSPRVFCVSPLSLQLKQRDKRLTLEGEDAPTACPTSIPQDLQTGVSVCVCRTFSIWRFFMVKQLFPELAPWTLTGSAPRDRQRSISDAAREDA